MPIAIAVNRKPTSRVSLTAFLKRMIDKAPTRLKARAMLLPMISITSDTTTPIMTIEHAVYSESQQQLVADGDSVVVLFDYSAGRPHRIPDDMRQLLEAFEGRPLDQ